MPVVSTKKSAIMKKQQKEVKKDSTNMPLKTKATTKVASKSSTQPVPAAAPLPVKPARPVNYLNNKDLVQAVKDSKKAGEMTKKLATMLILLCAKYGTKGNWAGYTYNTDMQGYAMMMLVRTWHGFDPDKGTNAFAWYTQCIKNSFIQFLNLEKRQRNVLDAVRVNQGLTPSFGYSDGTTKTHVADDEEDFETYIPKPEVIDDTENVIVDRKELAAI